MAGWIPDRTVDFTVDLDGTKYEGLVSVDIPEIKLLTETLSTAGMAGSVDVPLIGHIEPMTMVLKFRSSDLDFWRSLDATKAHALTLRSAFQGIDKASAGVDVKPFIIEARTMANGVKLGTVQANSTTDAEITFSISYVKSTYGGKVNTEIDVFNGVFVLDGKDQLSSVNSIINGV